MRSVCISNILLLQLYVYMWTSMIEIAFTKTLYNSLNLSSHHSSGSEDTSAYSLGSVHASMTRV